MKTTHYIIAAALSLVSLYAAGQQAQPVQKTTFLLPDGKELPIEKLDSLKNAWGEDRVIFMHTEEDFEKGIVRLLKKTDEDVRNDELLKETALAQKALLNQPAPQFELTDVKGKKWSLQELRGKKVVLNFWFNSCAPCIEEMPQLNALVAEYKDQDVVFLGLTFNSVQQASKFLEKYRFDYTVLPGSKEIDKLYKVSSWPASIVIDRSGVIRLIESSGTDIHNKIKSALDTIN